MTQQWDVIYSYICNGVVILVSLRQCNVFHGTVYNFLTWQHNLDLNDLGSLRQVMREAA